MKTLTVYAIAALLVMGTTAALAGNKHNNHNKHHGNSHNSHHNYKRHNNHHGGHHSGHRSGHYGSHYNNYLGVAMLGSALTYSFYHTHQGVACYQRHDNGGRYEQYNFNSSNTRHTEIVGCHRIEQLGDGRQLRVELPLAECR